MDQNNKSGTGGMVERQGSDDGAAVLVYATFPAHQAAEDAGRALIAARLAACVNILPSMTSIYRWDGKIERADEVVLIAKLPPHLADQAVAMIVAGHAYETPAVLVIPVASGAARYLDWIRAETLAAKLA